MKSGTDVHCAERISRNDFDNPPTFSISLNQQVDIYDCEIPQKLLEVLPFNLVQTLMSLSV